MNQQTAITDWVLGLSRYQLLLIIACLSLRILDAGSDDADQCFWNSTALVRFTRIAEYSRVFTYLLISDGNG